MEQIVTPSTIFHSIINVMNRRCCGILFQLFGVKTKAAKTRRVHNDWDYNLILAYAILAAAGSLLLAMSVPIIIFLLGLEL